MPVHVSSAGERPGGAPMAETAAPAHSTGASASSPMPPFFSVVVTAYRRRTFLRAAVESVLDQTIPRSEFEVIVLKDFADAELDAWLGGLGTFVRNVTEDLPLIGQMLARGGALARGSVVCFLDDDDRFHPDKLAGLRSAFREDPSLGLVHHAFDAIDVDGHRLAQWERYRPQPPAPRTWGPGVGRVDFPWLHHYGGYVNVSSMAIRTDLLRRWAAWLARVPTSQDVVLFTIALASDVRVRVDSSHWTDYRVHPSASHPTIGESGGGSDVRDFRKAIVTSGVLRAAVASAPGHPDAVRLSETWSLETQTVVFLLDPGARLTAREWLRLAISAVRRRQAYIGTMWVYCLYRWIAPERATRDYRAKRRGELLRTAATATPPAPP
jgi:hypothetical protein